MKKCLLWFLLLVNVGNVKAQGPVNVVDISTYNANGEDSVRLIIKSLLMDWGYATNINLAQDSSYITIIMCYEYGALNQGWLAKDTINIGVLPPGNYFIKVYGSGKWEGGLSDTLCLIGTPYDSMTYNFYIPYTNINESTQEIMFSLITNNGRLEIAFNNETMLDYKVYSMNGSILSAGHITDRLNNHIIDIGGLPAGIYLLEVQIPQGRAVKKLVVE